MKLRPSAIDEFLAPLPENLQILALQAIKEEHDRFERGDFTEEEKKLFQTAADLGTNAAKTIERIALKCITSGST
uniref:Uncharacterized protein n=1 Tax=viral metagenome TaxID=1070528 RepID=A0A6M3LJP9_9ZZZZ